MRFFEKARNLGFWYIDFLRGSQVRHSYEEIRTYLNRFSAADSKEKGPTDLNAILNHASSTVTFYKPFAGFRTIEDFPVINKEVIKSNYDSFLSDAYREKELHRVTTSGSTGAPLTVLQDKGKRIRHSAENIYFSEMAGNKLGSRLYYLRVWNDINRKSLIKSLSQNIIMQDAAGLSDSGIEKFLSAIENDNSEKSALAFSSTWEAIAMYITKKERRVKAEMQSLITISESLSDGARQVLKEAFNCPVISRYSNMENGFLAQQCGDDSGEYHLNTSGFYFELLHPDKNVGVGPGELGRVAVTDLFNRAMPLIRYDTGDMAIMSKDPSCAAKGPVLTKVEGRKVDFIYNTEDLLLSPHVITNTMWKYSGAIRQFQFIQNGKGDYTIRLNTGDSVFTSEKGLIDDLKHYLGMDALITTVYVNELPALASGKRQKIINNYKK